MEKQLKSDVAAKAYYFNLEKRMKVRLDYINSLNIPDYKYRSAIFQLHNEIFLDCDQYKILNVNMDYPVGVYVSDDGFRLDETEYPYLCRIVQEMAKFREEVDEKDEIEATNKMLFPDDEEPPFNVPSLPRRLPLEMLLKLELFDFFDYCRHGDGIPDLYIFKYIEKYTEGFKPELVQLIWRDFWPYFEAEKEDFYCDQDRVLDAIQLRRENGLEIPRHPDIDYVPPQRKEEQSDKQYDAICRFGKQAHDSQRGQVDVEKLLSVDSLDLAHLFRIKHILQAKEAISSAPPVKDVTPEHEETDMCHLDIEGAVKALTEYISGVSSSDFGYIIQHHSLPSGARRVNWIGSRVDASRFQNAMSWSMKTFNKVFKMQSGSALRSNDADKKGIDDYPGVCKVLLSLGLIQ